MSLEIGPLEPNVNHIALEAGAASIPAHRVELRSSPSREFAAGSDLCALNDSICGCSVDQVHGADACRIVRNHRRRSESSFSLWIFP